EHDREIQPFEKKTHVLGHRVRGLSFSGMKRKGRKQKNQKSAESRNENSTEEVHCALPPAGTFGRSCSPDKMAAAISPAKSSLDCSRCVRTVFTSSARACLATWSSCWAAVRAACTVACFSSSTLRRAASWPTNISLLALRNASL